MTAALYAGGTGFFTRPGPGPAGHFRTSAHTGSMFAGAVAALIIEVDDALGRPDPLDIVDVGAGRGELLTLLPDRLALRRRCRLTAVEPGPRPDGLPAGIAWRDTIPENMTGVLLATEWLDNVPLDVAVPDGDRWRYVLVDDAGRESLGPPVDAHDDEWIRTWWPTGERVEIGRPRDLAWADAIGHLHRGLALAVDYGHTRAARPPLGTLTGFIGGRQALPVPDGDFDLTAHVAADAVATAGSAVAELDPLLVRQSAALAALGVHGQRPPIEMAHRDPAAYLRALADASTAAELTDPAGLGGHYWLLQPVGVGLPHTMIR
jgi:SAM-dependent MidA family methyltransferase